jgi:hypothetical protein
MLRMGFHEIKHLGDGSIAVAEKENILGAGP